MSDFSSTLVAAREGAEWAVAALWTSLHAPLLRFLRGLNRDAAEDVESETWIRIARGLRGFEGGESDFRAWVFTIARNRMIDWCRQAERQRATPVAADEMAAMPDATDAAAAAVEELELEAALAVVRTLPRDQAEVILLRVLAGLDVARVAAIVGKRPGAVRVLQHRGLRRLAASTAFDARATSEATSR